MAQPYTGEIRMVTFDFAPYGWAICDGSLLEISSYLPLYQLIGTTYGGDGQRTFALPDLRGRIPMHAGYGYVLGQFGGSETVTVGINQMAAHTHPFLADSAAGSHLRPVGHIPATAAANVYTPPTSPTTMSDISTQAGGSLPHQNMMQSVGINYIIAILGNFGS